MDKQYKNRIDKAYRIKNLFEELIVLEETIKKGKLAESGIIEVEKEIEEIFNGDKNVSIENRVEDLEIFLSNKKFDGKMDVMTMLESIRGMLKK